MDFHMKNPALAIECARCAVPVSPALHPTPETLITCPQCEAAAPYKAVFAGCMTEIAARLDGQSAEGAQWRFRAGPPPVGING